MLPNRKQFYIRICNQYKIAYLYWLVIEQNTGIMLQTLSNHQFQWKKNLNDCDDDETLCETPDAIRKSLS